MTGSALLAARHSGDKLARLAGTTVIAVVGVVTSHAAAVTGAILHPPPSVLAQFQSLLHLWMALIATAGLDLPPRQGIHPRRVRVPGAGLDRVAVLAGQLAMGRHV
jgi:predicted transporter